jgi:hypothetical protein
MLAASAHFYLRPFGQHDREADYELLNVLANAQVPRDSRGNEEWLQHRSLRKVARSRGAEVARVPQEPARVNRACDDQRVRPSQRLSERLWAF